MSKIFADGSWRDLDSISVFNSDEIAWKTVQKGYVYTDLYGWEVFYPTPVSPTFSTIVPFSYFNGSNYSIEVELYVNNAVSVFVQLYAGTSPTGTPIQTGQASVDSITGSFFIVFSGLSNNSNYTLKFIATSETEDTAETTITERIEIASVNITSVVVNSSTSVTVNWSSSNQSQWMASLYASDGFTEIATSGTSFIEGSNTSYTFNLPNALASQTNYYAEVRITSSTFDLDEDRQLFTTPSFAVAESVISSVTPGYGSLSVLWTNNQYVTTGSLKLYIATFTQQGGWSYELIDTYNFTTQTSHTFSGLSYGVLYYIELVGFYNGASGPVSTWGPGYTLAPTAPDAPTMTSFYSTGFDTSQLIVIVQWSIPNFNGATVTGYVLQYRNSTSASWTTVYNGSSSSATSTLFSVSNIAQTVYLRMYTKSSDQDNSTYSYAQFSISNGLLPSLSTTRTTAGYTVSHSNYSSSYTYSGSATSPGTIVGSVQSTSFNVNIPYVFIVRPTISVNRTTRVLTCSWSGTWNPTPSVTTTVTSTRVNHTSRSSSVTNSPNRSTSYSYEFQFQRSGSTTWESWTTGTTTSTSASFTYSANITNTRTVRCIVTMNTGSYSDSRTTSNTVNIP
jgi:hypothetical protein